MSDLAEYDKYPQRELEFVEALETKLREQGEL